MSNVLLGIAAGLVFGVASVAMMLPMSFKAYAPVLVVAALGGLIIGGVIYGWLPRA